MGHTHIQLPLLFDKRGLIGVRDKRCRLWTDVLIRILYSSPIAEGIESE
jgi:hypothetical protein